MFFLTFLPQFVSVSDPHAGAKLMFLGLYFIALGDSDLRAADPGSPSASPPRSAARREAMRAIDYLFAGLMGAFAVRLLFARAD